MKLFFITNLIFNVRRGWYDNERVFQLNLLEKLKSRPNIYYSFLAVNDFGAPYGIDYINIDYDCLEGHYYGPFRY